MADNHTKAIRSKNMSHIRSKNTRPEEIVRKYLFAQGFRYRKNVKTLPGCPDIVLLHIPFASCHLHGKILPLCR